VHLTVSSYRMMLLVAALAAAVAFVALARRRGMANRRVAAAGAAFAAGALAGARFLGTINTDPSLPTLLAPRAAHFSIWGGAAGGVAAVLAVVAVGRRSARKRETPALDPAAFFDLVAPPAGIGIAVARVGCWLAGCCFGEPTSLPWGVRYPAGSPAHVAYAGATGSLFDSFAGPPSVHPIPLYEIAVSLAGVVIALWVWRRFVKPGRWAPGSSAAVFVAWYAAWRAVIESVRHESPGSPLPGWGWQVVFAAIAVGVIAWLVRIGANGDDAGPSGSDRDRMRTIG